MEAEVAFHAIQQTIIPTLLGKDVIYLAATCKLLFNGLKQFINNNIFFRYSSDTRVSKLYNPSRIRVGGHFGVEIITISAKHSQFTWNLSSSLTHLTFGHHFNLPVDNLLPPSLLHLTFGTNFNRSIDHLPSTLTHLELGDHFNQLILSLPPSLLRITVGDNFQTPLDKLPSSLTHLVLNSIRFVYALDSLPHSLTHLSCRAPNMVIPSLPPNLVSFHFHLPISGLQFPDSIVDLQTSSSISKLPPNLTHLKFSLKTCTVLPASLLSLETTGNIPWGASEMPRLPPKLQILKLSGVERPPQFLPPSLVNVDISLTSNNGAIEFIQALFALPNLTHLTLHFKCTLNWIAQGPISLPPKLLSLRLLDLSKLNSIAFTNSLDFPSAPYLCELTFVKGYVTEQQIKWLECSIPPRLTSLTLGSIMLHGVLPQTLQTLLIHHDMPCMLPNLPDNLIHLSCAKCNPPPSFPSTLQSLCMDNYDGLLPPLPPRLKYLFLYPKSVSPLPPLPSSLTYIDVNHRIPLDSIPPLIKTLKVQYSKDFNVKKLPLTIEYLTLDKQK